MLLIPIQPNDKSNTFMNASAKDSCQLKLMKKCNASMQLVNKSKLPIMAAVFIGAEESGELVTRLGLG